MAAAGAATLAIFRSGAANLPASLGMFAGSGTNTPTLQAILDALGSQDAAVGYSVAYPFGVAGPILCMYAYLAFFKPAIAEPRDRRLQPVEIRVRNAALARTSIRRVPAAPARGRARRRDSTRRAEPGARSLNRAQPRRCANDRGEPIRPGSKRASADWRDRRGSDGDRPKLARLSPRVCVEARRHRNAARRPEDSWRIRLQLHPRAAGRRRSAARQGPGAGVRRPRRRADQPREFRGGASLLRRLNQRRRRLQLHHARRRRRAGTPRRDDSPSGSRNRARSHSACPAS